MSTPTFYVVKRSLRYSRSATSGKDYHLTLVASENKALLIRRYGKMGAFGQMQVEAYHDVKAARADFDTLGTAKERKGYRNLHDDQLLGPFTDMKEILPAIGLTVWPKIGQDNADFIFGVGASQYQFKDADNPEFEQTKSGKWRRKEKPLNVIPDPEPTLQERIQSNSNWGMF